jgi:hypothetical protein
MIKKQQKWISLLVTLTFVWLLQVSTMPLAAANTTEQIGSANAEQAPRFIEEEGDSGYQVKKKSILPIILIGVGVVALAAVLFLVVLKTKYDIVGTWDFAYVSTSPAHTWTWTLVFTGDKKSGTFNDSGDTGTYTVNGKDVTIKYNAPYDISIAINGAKFDSKDTMSGTAIFTGITIGGLDINNATWTARRAGTTATIAKPLTSVEKKVRK